MPMATASAPTLERFMDFSLTADQIAIRDMVRGFAAEKIAPFATKWDEEKTIPRDVLKDAAGLGLAGITVREDQGGSGLGRVESALIFEELSYADPVVDRKSTRLNSSHLVISYAVFCLKKKMIAL